MEAIEAIAQCLIFKCLSNYLSSLDICYQYYCNILHSRNGIMGAFTGKRYGNIEQERNVGIFYVLCYYCM